MEPTFLSFDNARLLHGLAQDFCWRCAGRMCVCAACLAELEDPRECRRCQQGRAVVSIHTNHNIHMLEFI